jgi:amidohydrolase
MSLLAHIKQAAKLYQPQILNWRRHLHRYPELSFQEHNTQRFIIEQLKQIGIDEITKCANTGVIALIKGIHPEKKIIALRGDIDALPIQEQNDVAYKSTFDGIMHACGHDVHTSCLLGAAQILYHTKSQWEGTIKLLFQPGEEKLPGGASIMIQEGALQNPTPTVIYGQHVMPILPVGTVGFRSGLYMASTDELYIKVKGKGGHGAMPHLNNDSVLAAAQLIVSLQQLVSRRANPIIPSVLSIGKVIANGATNIIPNEVLMEGTFRTLDEQWRIKAHQLMHEVAQGIAQSMGVSVELEVRKGYPFLENDPKATELAKQAAIEYLGKDKVVDLDIWMAAEDFAYYSQEMPACFYRLGTRNEAKGITSSVHTPTFDIDENALEIGAGLMAWIAIQHIQN